MLKGYSIYEKSFLFIMLALQVFVYAISPESPISMIAGLAGVASVVMFAKGRMSAYFIGFIQNFTYIYLSYTNRFYGEVLEQLFYIITMIWGIVVWKNNIDEETNNVKGKKFTWKHWLSAGVISIIGTIGMGYLLTSIGSAQPYTDAATNVFAVIAQLLMVWRFREQWFWWLIIDLLCIKMWFVAGNWSMVAMYIAWTVNCIYGWLNWTKLAKDGEIV